VESATPRRTYKIAQAYAVLGDHSSALRAFRNSIENGFFAYPYFMTDPLMESVRNTTEFVDLVKSCQATPRSLQEQVLLISHLSGQA